MEINIGDEDFSIGGSIFWIIFILIATGSLMYMLIWSFNNSNLGVAIVSSLFSIMIIFGILLSRNKIFDWASWGDNALSFTIGFFFFWLIGSIGSSQSVIILPENFLYSTLASDLPLLVEVVLNVFIVPIAEELLWMIGIPMALISIMNRFGSKYDIWKNKYLQIAIVILISSFSFAYFHTGHTLLIFIISALIFRSILLVFVYSDQSMDIFKKVNLVAGFGLGSHIANNMTATGIGKTISILSTEPIILIIVAVLFGAIFLSGINRILRFFTGKSDSLSDGGGI